MKHIAFVAGMAALGLAASTAARADFAVIKFKDSGSCRAWLDPAAKPASPHQVLWAKVPTWEAAQAKGAYAIKHKWCKAWH